MSIRTMDSKVTIWVTEDPYLSILGFDVDADVDVDVT